MTRDGKIPAIHWKYDPCGSVPYTKNPRFAYKKKNVTCFHCICIIDSLIHTWIVECPTCKKICNGSNKKFCSRCGTYIEVEEHLKHWRDRK